MDMNSAKDEVLPYFIPEEAEKIVNQTPVWKIKLVKESLKYMMTDEDSGANFWGVNKRLHVQAEGHGKRKYNKIKNTYEQRGVSRAKSHASIDNKTYRKNKFNQSS